MSLWKFGDFEAEVDFTDADFLDRLHEAKEILRVEAAKVPKVGKWSDIIRAQCKCYYNFFDNLFWKGAGERIFEGKNSIALCVEAAESISAFEDMQRQHFDAISEKYSVQHHGNRQQRRAYQKNHKKQYSGRQG